MELSKLLLKNSAGSMTASFTWALGRPSMQEQLHRAGDAWGRRIWELAGAAAPRGVCESATGLATSRHFGSRQCADLHAALLGLIAPATVVWWTTVCSVNAHGNAFGLACHVLRPLASHSRTADENIRRNRTDADYRVIALYPTGATPCLGFQARTT